MLSLVAKKLGMSHIYKSNGSLVALTMVQVYDNCVIDVAADDTKAFDLLLMGVKKANKVKNVSKPLAGVFLKKNLPVYEEIYGCKIGKGLGYSVGDSIALDSVIKEGDFISVTGTTSGKGFAGVMKRHNFSGLEASHGVSISHRSHGSTGQRQDPGKVFKGKKMAGHMGVDKVTTKNLEVLIVDREKNLVAVRGALPGRVGSDLILRVGL